MRVLRRSWPLASILFVTLAGAEIASADKDSTTPVAGEVRPFSMRLFGRTWCLGQPPGVTCDVKLPPEAPPREAPAREASVAPAASPAGDGPFDRVMRRMKELFGGRPAATSG